MSPPSSDTAISTPEQLASTLPDEAQRHLDALRGAIDLRLAALEAALSDPSRGGALETLILDLARVATVEAQTAAAKACIDTRLAADTLTARAAAAAQQVLQQERAAAAELRRALEDSEQRRAKVEADLGAELEGLRQALDAEVARSRSAAADAQRALADAQARMERAQAEADRYLADSRKEAEHARQEAEKARQDHHTGLAANAELRTASARLEERLADLGKDHAQILAVHDETLAELERARDAVARLQQSLDAARAEVTTERTSLRETGLAAEKTARRLSELEADHAQTILGFQQLQISYDDLKNELEQHRAANAELESRLEEVTAALTAEQQLCDAERATNERLQQQASEVAAELQALAPEHAEARAAHARLVTEFAQERERGVALEQAHVELQQQLIALESDHQRVHTDFETATAKLEALRTQVRTLEEERGQLQQVLEAERLAQAQALARRDDVEHAVAAARAETAAVRAELDEMRERLAQAERVEPAPLSQPLVRELLVKEPVADEPLVREFIDDEPLVREPVADEPLVRELLVDVPLAIDPVVAIGPKRDAPVAAPASGSVAGVPDIPPPGHSSWVQVRLAERFKFKEPLTIHINGSTGLLCDLSVLGCQVVSGTALKPNQKIKVVLPTSEPLTCTGKVMWARLEPSAKGRGFGYRAGVQFIAPAQDRIAAFIDEQRGA